MAQILEFTPTQDKIGLSEEISYKSFRRQDMDRKSALMLRVGGVGDLLILTPIAKALYAKGYSVDYFCGSPTGAVFELLKGLPYFHDVKEITRVTAAYDCIEDEGKHYVSVEILKDRYDEVFDFKYSVEENNAGLNKKDEWRRTINSNYQNWVDLSLAWVNVDPSKVSDDDKRPEICFPGITNGESAKEIVWAQNETPCGIKYNRSHRVIGIQLNASSLIRTWYKAVELPHLIHEKYPDDVVLIFGGAEWIALTRNGKSVIKFPEKYNPLACSAALISQMDCFICADSGASHFAEALGIDHITIYTTVPGWTRSKYYKYAHPLETDVICHPCFALDIFCPLERKKAQETLSDREKEIIRMAESGTDIMEACRKFNSVPKAIDQEYKAAKARVEALSAQEAACVRSITSDMIIAKVQEILEKP